MSKTSTTFQEAIKAYLDQRAASDELFAKSYAKENKSIESCCNFIISEVKKSGRCGFADDEIFGMAVHYYDEDDLGEIKEVNAKVIVNHEIQLTEEEKAAAKAKALELYQQECLREEAQKARSARRNRIIRQKEEAMKAAEWEDRYKAEKNRYFGICFGDDEITISVIQSVAEMAEEGRAMHHCVYANEYFKKSDSLILSARDSEGKRLETVEVSLKTFSVVQSRAKFNQTTPQHTRILELVSKNIDKIKQAI